MIAKIYYELYTFGEKMFVLWEFLSDYGQFMVDEGYEPW